MHFWVFMYSIIVNQKNRRKKKVFEKKFMVFSHFKK